MAEGESAALKHPILVTKIDNSTSSSPQVGLSHADLVVEELVEGGITRLAVFFYSDVPDNAGPVRSMRASDIGIVPGDHATVVTSGAAGVTVRPSPKVFQCSAVSLTCRPPRRRRGGGSTRRAGCP